MEQEGYGGVVFKDMFELGVISIARVRNLVVNTTRRTGSLMNAGCRRGLSVMRSECDGAAASARPGFVVAFLPFFHLSPLVSTTTTTFLIPPLRRRYFMKDLFRSRSGLFLRFRVSAFILGYRMRAARIFCNSQGFIISRGAGDIYRGARRRVCYVRDLWRVRPLRMRERRRTGDIARISRVIIMNFFQEGRTWRRGETPRSRWGIRSLKPRASGEKGRKKEREKKERENSRTL